VAPTSMIERNEEGGKDLEREKNRLSLDLRGEKAMRKQVKIAS